MPDNEGGVKMKEKHFTCIVCPKSCKLTVRETENGIEVEGYTCKRGLEHGKREYTDPVRMLTTTVKTQNSRVHRLAVISESEIQKNKIDQCLEELYKVTVTAPVKAGDVIAENICGTGVNIVASRTLMN